MKQRKLLTMLVLLVAVVTGAWADSFSADAYAANATLNGVSVSTDQTVTINEGVTVTVNNGLSIQSNATLTVTGGGTLVVNGATGAKGDNGRIDTYSPDPFSPSVDIFVQPTAGGNGGAAITINSGAQLALINVTVIANGGQGGQGGWGANGDVEVWAANGANGNGFASFPTIDGAVMSYSTNGTDYTEYASGDKTLYRYMKAVGAPPTYSITLDEGTGDKDSQNWEITPGSSELSGGEAVTVKYNGSREVKSVTVVKKAASITLDNTITAWTAGSYAVPAGGLTYSDAVTVSGDVTLTLTDGETLTLNKGISLAEGATLTVEGNGTMNVNGTNDNSSSTVAGSGMMCFKSGTLVATGGNGHVGNDLGQYGMNGGISHGGSAINGSLTLEGGNVTATGGNGGNAGGANNINMATGGNGGSAITGNVIINGGNWTANNGSNGTLLSGGSYNVAGTGGKAVAGTVTDNRQ